MIFETPSVEFIEVDLDIDVSSASDCITSRQRASGVETCDCSDDYKDGATGADEPDCGESFEF